MNASLFSRTPLLSNLIPGFIHVILVMSVTVKPSVQSKRNNRIMKTQLTIVVILIQTASSPNSTYCMARGRSPGPRLQLSDSTAAIPEGYPTYNNLVELARKAIEHISRTGRGSKWRGKPHASLDARFDGPRGDSWRCIVQQSVTMASNIARVVAACFIVASSVVQTELL